MGHVSSIVKGQSSASKSGIWWQEEKLPDGDQLSGKYQSVSHYDDGNYVKVWYNGDKFIPESTYTDAYCKKNNLGKYANGGSSSKGAEKVKKSTSSGGTESFWIKLLFTIIPLLPIWWLIKLPFKFIIVKLKSIVNAIFCGCCSDGGDSEWPAYSFIKF